MKDRIFKTKIAYDNWRSKYQYNKESPLETFRRAAKAAANVEKDHNYWEDKFFRALVKVETDGNGEEIATGLKATLGGRITANIGTSYSGTTMLNCFVNGGVSGATISYEREIPGTDDKIPVVIKTQDSPDSLANIMLSALEQAMTLKSEGGYGTNFGYIRPRGALVNGIGIKHPGVVSYMGVWDKISEVIIKGSNDGYKDTLTNYLSGTVEVGGKKTTRKGAMMGSLPSIHPDLEEFVRAKQQPGVLTKFNLSVLVDDELMFKSREIVGNIVIEMKDGSKMEISENEEIEVDGEIMTAKEYLTRGNLSCVKT